MSYFNKVFVKFVSSNICIVVEGGGEDDRG